MWGWDRSGSAANTLYAAIKDIEWDGVRVDFSGRRWDEVGEPFYLIGDEDAVELYCNQDGKHDTSHGVGHPRPYIKDFSDFLLWRRGAELLGTPLVQGGFVADPRYPWTANCPTV